MENMAFELYRVNGRTVNRQQFYELLENTLKRYPFASLEQIVLAMKADKRYTEDLVLDYIVEFAKKYPGISVSQLSEKLLVSTKFIDKLIKDDRIVVTDMQSLSLLDKVQEKSRELNQRLLEQPEERDDKVLVRQLNQTLAIKEEPKTETLEHKNVFHTSALRERTASFSKKYTK